MANRPIGINNLIKDSMKAEILEADVELDLARRWKNDGDEKPFFQKYLLIHKSVSTL